MVGGCIVASERIVHRGLSVERRAPSAPMGQMKDYSSRMVTQDQLSCQHPSDNYSLFEAPGIESAINNPIYGAASRKKKGDLSNLFCC